MCARWVYSSKSEIIVDPVRCTERMGQQGMRIFARRVYLSKSQIAMDPVQVPVGGGGGGEDLGELWFMGSDCHTHWIL